MWFVNIYVKNPCVYVDVCYNVHMWITIYGHEYFKSVENRGVLVVPRKVTIINNDDKPNKVDELINEEEKFGIKRPINIDHIVCF